VSCAPVCVGLKEQIRKVCQEEDLVCGEGEEQGGAWMEKVSPQSSACDLTCSMLTS
jgi:dynein heavy chain 1